MSQTTLNISTSENSNCSYVYNSNKINFTTTGSLLHKSNFSISEGNTYSVTYNCSNTTENIIFYTYGEDYSLTTSNSLSNVSTNITLTSSRRVNATLYYGLSYENYYLNYSNRIINTSLNTSILFQLINLTENTTYYFTIRTTDEFDIDSNISGSFTTIDTTAPNISFSNSTLDRSISITYSTTENSNCTLSYGTSSSYSNSTSSEGLDFIFNWYNLTPETLYYFKINCSDSSNNYASETFTLTTSNDSTPPVITLVYPTNDVDDDDVTIRLKTNEPAQCSYSSRDDYNYSQSTVITSTDSYTHNFSKNNMDNGNYDYYIKCKDTNNHIQNKTIRIKISYDIINETFYGSESVDDTYIPKEKTIKYDFQKTIYNSNEDITLKVNKEELIIEEITIYKNEKVSSSSISIRQINPNDVEDTDAVILQALEFDTEKDYSFKFKISNSWLKMKNIDRDLIRYYYFDNTWKKKIPIEINDLFETSKLRSKKIVIGFDPREALDRSRIIEKENQKKKQEKIISNNVESTKAVDEIINYVEPIKNTPIKAEPINLTKTPISLIITFIILIVTVGIALFTGYEMFVKKKKNFNEIKKDIIMTTKNTKEEILDILKEGIEDIPKVEVKNDEIEYVELDILKELKINEQKLENIQNNLNTKTNKTNNNLIKEEILIKFINDSLDKGFKEKSIISALERKGIKKEKTKEIINDILFDRKNIEQKKKLDQIYNKLKRLNLKRGK